MARSCSVSDTTSTLRAVMDVISRSSPSGKTPVSERKSRIVVQGFSQVEGVDFTETYAPVAKVTTFRLMLALAKVLNLHIHQLDVDSAFLYADLKEDVFMKPPPGMNLPEGYCLKLLKNLYGLKQAPQN